MSFIVVLHLSSLWFEFEIFIDVLYGVVCSVFLDLDLSKSNGFLLIFLDFHCYC